MPTHYDHHMAYLDPVPEGMDNNTALQGLNDYILIVCGDRNKIFWRVEPTIFSCRYFDADKLSRRALARFSIKNGKEHSREFTKNLTAP